MKKVFFIFLVFSGIQIQVFSQNPEFPIYSNGLIYNDTTVSNLIKIVDSNNLRYKKCNLNKVYYSKLCAKGHDVFCIDTNLSYAYNDIRNHISYSKFIKKYPRAEYNKDLLYHKIYRTYNNDIEYESLKLDNSMRGWIRVVSESDKSYH